MNTVKQIQIDNCHNVIQNYIDSIRKQSENTYENYLPRFKNFFMKVINKELHSIKWEDIFSITFSDVEDYQKYLLVEKENIEYTVDQKLFTIKGLWDYLYKHNNNVNKDVLDFVELYNKDTDENSWGTLLSEELDLLFKFAETRGRTGKIQRAYFEFLYDIACRKSVPLKMKWSQVKRGYDFKSKQKVWLVCYTEKGKKVEKAIRDEWYDKLASIRKEGSDEVFNIGKSTIENTFEAFREKYNLFERNNKRIVIHSIKKAAGQRGWDVTHDPKLVQEYMQHSDFNTTMNIYNNRKDNYTEQLSYKLGFDIDINEFKDLSKEELISLIEKCDKNIMYALYNKMLDK